MCRVELTDEERDIIKEFLSNDLADLRMEIRETDVRSFKDELKQKEEVLKKILTALEEGEKEA